MLGEYQPHRLVDGKRIPEGEPIPDFYPPVVEREVWNAARAAVEAKTRSIRKAKMAMAKPVPVTPAVDEGEFPLLPSRLRRG